MLPRAWSSRLAPWVASGLAVLGVTLVALFVDVSPQVEGDFFFAEDDPQMQASRAVAERFPSSPQIILRVEDRAGDTAAYRARVGALTEDLLAVEGITGGYSIATDDPTVSPLFGRILLTPNPSATNVILSADQTVPEILLPRLEAVIERARVPELGILISGVPVIVELIRRSLYRDLVVFSLAAVLAFGLIIGVVYRDAAVVVGMLATCFVAVSITLIIAGTVDIRIGLLTANLVTIVFVLTLSHVVFLTSNWRRAAGEVADRGVALLVGIRETFEGSFWSMATTLLGFLSLLVASAKPLRDLGIAGAWGRCRLCSWPIPSIPPSSGAGRRPRPASEIGAALGGRYGGTGHRGLWWRRSSWRSGSACSAWTPIPACSPTSARARSSAKGSRRSTGTGGAARSTSSCATPRERRVDSPPVFVSSRPSGRARRGLRRRRSDLAHGARRSMRAPFRSPDSFPFTTLLDIASSPQLDRGRARIRDGRSRAEAHYFLRMRESLHSSRAKP
jgi:hypothetical protein